MKFAKKSSFKRLARIVLCLLLCVSMLGTTGVLGAVQAFGADKVTHRYQLEDVAGTIPDQAAYGYVINYVLNGTTWQKVYQKVVTANNAHWGQWTADKGDNNKGKKYFVWHTGDGTAENPNKLDSTGASNADIIVYYDDSNAYKNKTQEHIPAWIGEGHLINYTNETAFVDIHIHDATGDRRRGGDDSNKGGALWQKTPVTGTIKADFISNYITTGASELYGGALCNEVSITGLIGDFLDNHLRVGNAAAHGGAIYNTGEITALTGDFLGNYVDKYELTNTADGGAISNGNGGEITVLTGDFIGNYIYAYQTEIGESVSAYGGAISNGGKITGLKGDFLDNYVNVNIGEAYGGAICNGGNDGIGTIEGNFTGNYVSGDSMSGVSGGAIYNGATIEAITGNFTGNYASAFGASGGAIYNEGGTISKLIGNFTGNYASANTAESMAMGGAIYNEGDIKLTGNFINNSASAIGEGSKAIGGAIFNSTDTNLKIVTAGKDIVFRGNYVYVSATSEGALALGGAIYNAPESTPSWDPETTFEAGIIHLCAEEGKQITFVGDKNNATVDSRY